MSFSLPGLLQDGKAHSSLTAKEMLYFTLAYDWLTFGCVLYTSMVDAFSVACIISITLCSVVVATHSRTDMIKEKRFVPFSHLQLHRTSGMPSIVGSMCSNFAPAQYELSRQHD